MNVKYVFQPENNISNNILKEQQILASKGHMKGKFPATRIYYPMNTCSIFVKIMHFYAYKLT